MNSNEICQRVSQLVTDRLAAFPLLNHQDAFLVGGAFASVAHGDEPRDLDIVLRRDALYSMVRAALRIYGLKYHPYDDIAEIWSNRLVTVLPNELVSDPSSTAICFKRNCVGFDLENGTHLEFFPIDASPQKHVEGTFDFLHVIPVVDYRNRTVVGLSDLAWDSIETKTLRLVKGSKCSTPLGTYLRAEKLQQRGWKWDPVDKLRLFVAMRNMRPHHFEAQMVGFRGDPEMRKLGLKILRDAEVDVQWYN